MSFETPFHTVKGKKDFSINIIEKLNSKALSLLYASFYIISPFSLQQSLQQAMRSKLRHLLMKRIQKVNLSFIYPELHYKCFIIKKDVVKQLELSDDDSEADSLGPFAYTTLRQPATPPRIECNVASLLFLTTFSVGTVYLNSTNIHYFRG